MDRKAIFETYGKYYDVIHEIGKYPLLDFPTVGKVFKNKSLIQSVYKDMKAIRFRGTAIEFVCWLSMVFVVDSLKKDADFGNDLLKWSLMIIDNYKKYLPDSKNLVRLWAYYVHFPSSFKAAVLGEPYPSNTPIEEEWGEKRDIKNVLRSDAAFSTFVELIVYEDVSGKERDDMAELLDFIKKLVTAKVE